ncbi:hypothetical protein [Gimesia sp.]|uniref:hypothetical protein n=1 Tax=Gimesia sp. TaxID=2024833 RepID=UPI003A8DD5AA
MSSAFVMTTRLIWKRAWPPVLFWSGLFVLIPFAFLRIEQYLAGPVSWRCGNRFFTDYALYYFSYLCMSSAIFMNVSMEVIKDCRKICLGLPVSSRVIASWMMLTVVAMFVAMQLMTNGLYRLLILDQRGLSNFWPLKGPLLFLVTLILVGYCFYWLLQNPSLPRLLAGIILLPGMLVWFVARFYPDGFNEGLEPWNRVTSGEWGTMLGVSLGAWYLGTGAFAQIRSGTAQPGPAWELMKQWWNRLAVGARSDRETDPRSQTAIATLKQVHWRNSCRSGVLIGFGLAGVAFCCNLAAFFIWAKPGAYPRPGYLLPVMYLTYLFMQIAVVVLGLKQAYSVAPQPNQQIKDYWVSVPLTDRELAAALKQNILKAGMLVLLAMILLGVGGSYLLYALIQGLGVISSDWQWLVERELVATLIGLGVIGILSYWSIMLNFISVFWFPRQSVGLWVVASLIVLLIFSVTVSELLPVLRTPVILLDACLILGGTVLAFWHAYRSALIGGKTIWRAALFSLLLCIAFWDSSKSDLFLLSALLVFTVLPFATIPLVVSWNRHQ